MDKNKMRPIKFRAWWKPYKKMVYSDDLALPNITFGGVCVRPIRTVVNGLELSIDDNISYEYDLMQFTGLRDKNGKDLDWWEGDIFARSSDRRIEGVIIFDLGCFWLDRARGGRTLLYECVDWSMYKIGDVHENPELIEETNA